MALVVRPNLRLHPTPKLRRPPIRASSSHQPHGAEGRKLLSTKITRGRGRNPVIYCLPGASLREEGTPESSSKPKMILWSDVMVKKPGRRVYWGRKWSSSELITAGVILLMHLLCLFAPFTFNWKALWTAVLLYVITGMLGITLSFHRNLAHRSFTLPKWLEYSFAYCGALALQLQGNPLDWVSTHRYHHQYCDSAQDPHSPTEGFWYSHMSWLFDTASLVERCGGISNVGDLEKQPFYRFLRQTYMGHPVALALLLSAIGGLPFVVWGMGVRTVWVYHITWLVNSACHVWGRRAWNTGDLSRNNWWVAVLAFGEGWHNNHHAFEYSARHGLEWWEVDMTWYVVRLLQALGLAVDVKLPSERQKQRMSLAGTGEAVDRRSISSESDEGILSEALLNA